MRQPSAKTEAAVTYIGRPIALALAVVSSTLVAPAAMPRNRSAEAGQAATATAAAKPAFLWTGTTVVAKLLANLDSRTCKPGDPVEAEVTRDVSQNHKVVLKAGARVIGHVVALDASSTHSPESRIAISFNSISTKSGEQLPISFVIQALAIAPGLKEKDELHGRPMETAAIIAATGSIGGPLSEGLLRPEDSGVYGIAGLSLAVLTTETGSQFPVLKSAGENIRLAKGTQMVLRVVQN